MLTRANAIFAVVVLAAGTLLAADYSHKDYFEHYEGTTTCLGCHEGEAESFFHSQHYQWRGETPQIADPDGKLHGKLDIINDFCTNPLPNWIGEVRNSEGTVLAAGCSKCHAGHGLVPSPTMSREQLENIDCLICHASGYRRGVYRNDDGSWQWRPILWQNQEGLDSVSKRISLPTRTMCLRCHSASGGGPNFKRGDIEYTLASDAERDFDVHMSSDGADLQCIDCHAGEDHRVRGRGADIAATDSPDLRLRCDDSRCHERTPHTKALLNQHATRVDCTVCHIATYAKDDPTDMFRDWSEVSFSAEKGKFVAAIETGQNLVPTYAWWNGTSRVLLPGTRATFDQQGRVEMALPVGSKDDPGSRLHAFKVHRAKLPLLAGKDWILPIQTEEFYAHGDIDRAVREATEVYYRLEDIDYSWVEVIRYMGLFHEVQPADQALGCLDCHGPDGRLDWTVLGYSADPLAACLQPSTEPASREVGPRPTSLFVDSTDDAPYPYEVDGQADFITAAFGIAF